jgi:hypothetical protein
VQGSLARAGFLLLTGLILGLFLGAALFGQRAPRGVAQRGFTGPGQARPLAAGEQARTLPPGHPPVEGFADRLGTPDEDSSGCPYLDSGDADGDDAAYEDGDAPQPLPRARPLPAETGRLDGPI